MLLAVVGHSVICMHTVVSGNWAYLLNSFLISSNLQWNKHMLAVLFYYNSLRYWLGLIALLTSSRKLNSINWCICHLGSSSQGSWEMETGLCESHYTPSSLRSSFFFPFTSQLHNCIFLFYANASLCAKRQRQCLVSFYWVWMPSVPLEILQPWPTPCIILTYIISKNTHK